MAQINRISWFENLARSLIEGSFDKILGQRPLTNRIAGEFAKAVEADLEEGNFNKNYTILLDPEAFEAIKPDQNYLSQKLEEFVVVLGAEANRDAIESVSIEIASSQTCKPGEVQVLGYQPEKQGNPTQVQRIDPNKIILATIRAVDAFLIVNGKRHIQLDQPLVSIGRHLDNDIVLEEQTVSRQHAQIRWRYGRFVLYDLGSRSGTYLNGERIDQCPLQAGDVIQLGETIMIFGMENQQIDNFPPNNSIDDGVTRDLSRDN